MRKSLICILMMLVLSSCSYLTIRKPIIEQGNIITSEDTSKLHVGMSYDQVIAILGDPVLENVFTPNRKEYVYIYQGGPNKPIEKHMALIFNQGRLETISIR